MKEKIDTDQIVSCKDIQSISSQSVIYSRMFSGPYKASKQLIYMMIEELYIMSKFENWTETGRIDNKDPTPSDRSAYLNFKAHAYENHLHWIFLATRAGITAYWRLYHAANEEHIR